MSAGEYPRPSLTVDVVLLRFHAARLQLLLIERKRDPFVGCYALPGGFVDVGEAPPAAAARELLEETGTAATTLLDLGVFGEPERDPRGWVVSAAYLGLAAPDVRAAAGDDAATVRWFPVDELPSLAFDHALIIARARERLAELAQTGTVPLSLLPAPFRSRQARRLYAQITGRAVPPRPFKAWLRRREAVTRVGPSRFEASDGLHPDWLR